MVQKQIAVPVAFRISVSGWVLVGPLLRISSVLSPLASPAVTFWLGRSSVFASNPGAGGVGAPFLQVSFDPNWSVCDPNWMSQLMQLITCI